MNKAMPSIEYLRECFDMDENGVLTWKARPSRHFVNGIAERRWSGVKGVLWDKKAGQWRAAIRHQGKRFQKNFRSIDEAAAWADEVRRGVHGEFARSE